MTIQRGGGNSVSHPADIRAHEILSRLPECGPVTGAEIGIYKGALSRRLLADERISLVMVDSWEGNGAAYEDGDDWHAGLSSAAQTQAYFTTLANVVFAGSRARVVRARSLDTVAKIEDKTLDFVFLDADHSREAVEADISAWLPKVRLGGWIGGHDYGHQEFPGVAEAVAQFGKPDLGGDTTWFLSL